MNASARTNSVIKQRMVDADEPGPFTGFRQLRRGREVAEAL